MSLDWIREQSRSRLMSDDIDYTEVYVGYDFALRPEIIGFLAEQTATGQPFGFKNHSYKTRLDLDEHELAIG